MNIDEAELLDGYKEKLLAMRIEIIKLKSENQKLRLEIDALKAGQRKGEYENNEIYIVGDCWSVVVICFL